MLESGGEKTQPVPQKQRKNACMTIILLLTTITVGGGVYHGMINGGHVIDTAYGQTSVLLVTNETVKLTASDGAEDDFFGISVSVYNNTAVIGAPYDDDNGPDSGSAYVFEKNSTSGNWTQTETVKLTASDGAEDDRFGRSVSVYNNTAVIGARFDDDNGPDSGSAYVFEKNSTSGNWTQKQKLTASDGAEDDYFGYSVSLYNTTAVIGALYNDGNGSNSGSAYVFEKNSTSGNWTQKQKLLASDAAESDWFGISVSVYNNTAVIGAFLDGDNNSGSAYVFEKNSTSGNWTQTETVKLTASDGAEDDYFGYSVSVYNNTAVIGAVLDDDNGPDSGSAYVFEKNSTSGNWTQTETVKLTASDGAEGDYFGYSVSVYNNTAVIGARFDDDNGPDSGSAYVFEKNSTSSNWTQTETVKLTASDGAEDDRFGRSVSVYNNTAVIGAPYDNDNGFNSGSAYVFTILQAPTANAGADQTVNEGTADIQLNGTGSADPNDDTITYAWSQTRGPTVTLSSSTSVSPTFDAPLINSNQVILTFSLTVNDGTVDSTPDTVDITVSNVNTTPTANAGADQTVNEGTTDIQLNGTGSADPNDDTITYAWSQTRGPTVTLSSSTSVSPTFDAPLINSNQVILTFSLTVNDGTVDSTPDTVDITVSNVNTTPTANAGADQTVNEGTTDIQLNGTGSADPNDDTITYAWSQTRGPTVTLSSSISASPTFDAPLINSEQTLTFSLTVNDGTVDSTPDTVDITVSNVNTTPTANAGADQTVNEGTTDIQLNGTGSADPNDDTITYAWSQTRGPTVTLSSSTSVSPTFDAPAVNSNQAILTFSLTVNDGTVDSTPDTVDITVLDTDDVLLTFPGSPSGSSGGGGSGSSSGIGISGGGRGISTWVDDIYLKSVSWDCNAGTIKIIAGPDSDYISVAVHTTQLGIHQHQ